jgi:hypothetical protein
MKNSTNEGNGTTITEETNPLIQNLNIAPSTLNQPKLLQFDEINVMGNMTD